MLLALKTLAIQLLAGMISLTTCNSILQEKFTRYAILKPDMIQIREKRDAHTRRLASKTLIFSVLARKFVLNLSQSSSALHPDFQAVTVGADGAEMPFFVNRESFYAGFLEGEPTSWVDIVYMEGIWVGRVFTNDEIYSIEPLRHHDPDGPLDLMIVFSNRDEKINVTETNNPFCQEVHLGEGKHLNRGNLTIESGRRKRQKKWRKEFFQSSKKVLRKNHVFESERHKTPSSKGQRLLRAKRTNQVSNVCELLAVADYHAYMGIGEGSVRRTVGILLNVYQTADRIFNSTKFSDLAPQRIKVISFIVHTSYTVTGSDHYNKESSPLDGRQTIELLTTFPYFKRFCLMHLTIQKHFGETLGLAATAENSEKKWANGICGGYGTSARNVGLSTTLRVGGQPMPITSYALVVAHELGHNFGSSHDPDNSTCSPSTKNGGKYLMWPRAGLGLDPNAVKFSPCSLQVITETLKKKSHRCFKKESTTNQVCGDGQVDYPEDCDVGYREQDDDPCCSLRCRFRDNAVCSPYNHPCCTRECQAAGQTVRCRDESIQPCHGPAFCTGAVQAHCGAAVPLQNNATCGDRGMCWHGRCLSFCEVRGLGFHPPRQLLPCTCDQSVDTMCYHCCRDAVIEGSCANVGVRIADGLSCLLGYCMSGVCIKVDKSDIQRLEASGNNGNQALQSFVLMIFMKFALVS